MSRVTLQTIADRVGVSRMTVSNAFSRPDQLSSVLRDTILSAAQDLGYVGPDPSARALARGMTGAVGVLVWDSIREAFRDEVTTGFFGALAEELGPTGMAMTFLPSSAPEGVVPARDIPMDAALVFACAGETPALTWLLRRKVPLVYIDDVPVAGGSSVVLDERAGSRAAAQHLVDLGHRRVGLVTMGWGRQPGVLADPGTAGSDYVSRERVQGWLEVLSGASVDAVAAHAPANTDTDAYDATRSLFAAPSPPTAILCFSDVMALGVLHYAHDHGLQVPRDLSVVGFDDSPLALRTRPALTTVRQDLRAKGKAAADALSRAIARRRAGEPQEPDQTVLPTELVIRDSTGPVPAPS